MFCTSLRKRSSLAHFTATLKSPPLSLRESQLDSHDLEIPFGSTAYQLTAHAQDAPRLRVLLISVDEVQQHLDETLDRIQRFAGLTGGRFVAIVFLLTPPSVQSNSDSSVDGVFAYTKLQTEMMHYAQIPHVPILLLASIDGLPRLFERHITALTRTVQQPAPLANSFDLLQQCSVEPMSQQTAFVLSDLFPTLSDLSLACSSVTSAPNSSSPSARAAGTEMSTQSSNVEASRKLKVLHDLVGDQVCRNIVDFWKEEWTVD